MDPINETQRRLAHLIRATAESLWDVSESILSTGQVEEGDWELARAAASHMLAVCVYPATHRRGQAEPKTRARQAEPQTQSGASAALFPEAEMPKQPQKDVG